MNIATNILCTFILSVQILSPMPIVSQCSRTVDNFRHFSTQVDLFLMTLFQHWYDLFILRSDPRQQSSIHSSVWYHLCQHSS